MQVIKVDDYMSPEAGVYLMSDASAGRAQNSRLISIFGILSVSLVPMRYFLTLIEDVSFIQIMALSFIGLLLSSGGIHLWRNPIKNGKRDSAIAIFFAGMMLYFVLQIVATIGIWIGTIETRNPDWGNVKLYTFIASQFILLIPMISLALVENDRDAGIFQAPRWNIAIAIFLMALLSILNIFASAQEPSDPLPHVLLGGYIIATIMIAYAAVFTPIMHEIHMSKKF